MLRYFRSTVGHFFVVMAGVLTVPGLADGVAVLASLADASGTEQTRTRLADALNVDIEISTINIDGTSWTRLHSILLPEDAARELVARAQRSGISAWYNGTGASLVTSSSAAAASVARRAATTSAVIDEPRHRDNESDYGFALPATGDISHLPLAETFPLLEPAADSRVP